MTSPALVIVESPAKAKTIEKYLGGGYTVLASYGHVRDLPAKNGSVLPDDDFRMAWELGERAAKPFSAIEKALKKADILYLATDPDREGEAISWHVQQMLQDRKLLAGKTVRRVTFNEITKTAIKEAFTHARDVDQDLVDAYLARRALDYLVGFTLSPVLWRKLPGSRSAGRVQSVALRLICERESEIEKFRADEYWTIAAKLHTPDGIPFFARLTHLSGNKLDKLDIPNEAAARHAADRIMAKKLRVTKIEKKQVRRNPYPPFITSSLQMEASRKLGFGAATTMRLAQQLYEGIDYNGETVGLITYMRTDGITLSGEAIGQTRAAIENIYGKKYVPDSPRAYKSKAKNAQEAHEAIRPTDMSRKPWEVAKQLSDDRLAKLYDLIWKRTMACQMESAILDQVAADLSDGTDDVILRANGSTIQFDGFLKLYSEDRDDKPKDDDDDDEKERRLPPLNQDDPIKTVDVTPDQHFTEPPPRYSEASLVKRMEELGIGRPSTYASIIQVLQDRKYVTLDRKRFTPDDRGRLVTTFLVKYFTKYVDYDFTANLESELDAISAGHVFWKEALRQFWTDFSGAIEGTADLKIRDVLDMLNAELGDHLFPQIPGQGDPRVCPVCGKGGLSLRLGKFGAFIGCSDYPECKFTRPLVVDDGADGNGGGTDGGASGGVDVLAAGPKELGTDPLSGRTVTLRKGPYGPYVQIDAPPESKDKPKRQGLPRGLSVNDVDLAGALKLLELPRNIGPHPETGKMITAGIGRFGPFVKHDTTFASIPKDEDVLSIGMNRAVDLITQKLLNPPKGRWGKKKAPEEKKEGTEKPVKAKKAPAKKAAVKKTAAKKSTVKKKTATATVKKTDAKKK